MEDRHKALYELLDEDIFEREKKSSVIMKMEAEMKAMQVQAEYSRKLADVASSARDARMMEEMWAAVTMPEPTPTPKEPKPMKRFKVKDFK